MIRSSLATLLLLAVPCSAATISPGDATVDLGPDLFIDEVVSGGGDVTVNQGVTRTIRKDLSTLGPLNVGPTGTEISITGIAWFGPNWAGTDATSVKVGVLYLGADGVGGGGDDVLLGEVTDNFTFGGAADYVWEFDSPVVGEIDGANSFFRFDFDVQNTDGSFRMKQQSPFGIKMTVGGTSVAVPEPSSIALLALATVAGVVGWRRIA